MIEQSGGAPPFKEEVPLDEDHDDETITTDDITTTGSSAGDKSRTLQFIVILFLVIIAWILITLWNRVIDAVATDLFGIDINSLSGSLVVAFVLTLVFIALAYLSNLEAILENYGL